MSFGLKTFVSLWSSFLSQGANPAKVVLGLLINQNKDLRTEKWKVVKVGDKKETGQHYLIQLHRDDIPKLEQRH